MHDSKSSLKHRHCAVVLAAVVGHDAGGKLTRNRTGRRLISLLAHALAGVSLTEDNFK